MNESSEQITHNEPSIFTDWSSYKGEELKENLKGLGITYIEPQEDKDLRDSIREFFLQRGEDNIDDLTKMALKLSLKFLEMGMMVDNFGSNEYGEDGRHKFLSDNRVKIGDEEITLYELSKRVSKLSGNKISQVITLAQLINDEKVRKKGEELKEKVIKIKQDTGYFIPDDLKEIDELALMIINHIINSQPPPSDN